LEPQSRSCFANHTQCAPETPPHRQLIASFGLPLLFRKLPYQAKSFGMQHDPGMVQESKSLGLLDKAHKILPSLLLMMVLGETEGHGGVKTRRSIGY
jgi:hypothetical protein